MTLKEKIINRSAIVGVIGLGYVGLPLAIAFAESGFKVMGFDVRKVRVDAINKGMSYINDINPERVSWAIADNLLEATKDQSRISEVDIICICVPTPLTKVKEPDLSYVVYESKKIAKYLRKGQLVILESTTYPGTTKQLVLPILEVSKLKCGIDFFLAYSPERVDSGNKDYGVLNTPKIVGGINLESTELARLFYSQVVKYVYPVASPEVAEMAKVFENVFRSVNIALVNELAQLCHNMKVSVWDVIEATSTKPFGYMPFYPSVGVGGHCIPLDPYYLANKAREYDFHIKFIELAAEINEHMPYYVGTLISNALNRVGKSVGKSKIIILGVAYKKDIDDIRESPSLKLIEILKGFGGTIEYNDPYVKRIQADDTLLYSKKLSQRWLSSADCVVITVAHSVYDISEIVTHSKLVFDACGVTKGLGNKNIVRLGE